MATTSTAILKKLLILFLIFAGLHYAKGFLMPLSIGTILATLFLPFCKWLEKKKVPRGLAAFICMLTLLAAVICIAVLIGWQISELTNDITLLKQTVITTSSRIQEYIFDHLDISAEKQWEFLREQRSSFGDIVRVVAGSFAPFLTSVILIFVYVFLLLLYRTHVKNFILKLFPKSQQAEVGQVVYSATHVSQQCLVGIAKMIVCLWIMYSIGFTLLGVKNAIFFAIICGLLEIVPFIGNITGTSITVLVNAVQGASLPILAGIIITYGVVQFIQGWVLEPLILGKQVKINPLFTIIALVIGELVWGIPGIIIAIPLTAIFKIVCDHIESLNPYGFLVGEIETEKKRIGTLKKIKNLLKKMSMYKP